MWLYDLVKRAHSINIYTERQGHLWGLRGVGVKTSFNRIMIAGSHQESTGYPPWGLGWGIKKLHLTGFMIAPSEEHRVPTMGGEGVKT